jgi:lipid-A-disaccharide synthase
MSTSEAGPLLFLVAGEPSGDALGARLMAALRAETGGRVRFAGVGGEQMQGQGLDSLFPMVELSVMGLVEVLPHLRRLRRRLRETVAAATALRPDAVVTIDSPGFTLRVQRRLAGLAVPRIHYVAPQVWAWKPWRARTLGRDIDHLLALLPFEPPLFEAHGLATTFVGHPAVERAAEAPDPAAFRAAHGIARDAPLLCLLPGSRRGEVDRLLPVFAASVTALARRFGGLAIVLPTVAGVASRVDAAVATWAVPVRVVTGERDKLGAFAAADAALAASGTVAAELAVAGTPTVIAYRMNPVTGWLARRLVRVPYVSLPNLVLNRPAQPEYLLEHCTPDNLVPAVSALLSDPDARARAKADGDAAAAALGAGGAWPSRRAAQAILEALPSPGKATGDAG